MKRTAHNQRGKPGDETTVSFYLRNVGARAKKKEGERAFSSPEVSVSFGHVVGETEQPLPDVRNFLTSVSACVVAFDTTAHAHMLIQREGEGREFI